MKRKIVKQGAATLMVSLPSKWAREQGIGKGDEIDIEEEGNSLVISKERKGRKREISFKIDEESRKDLRTLLTHAYRQGFDRIILNGLISSKEVNSIIYNYLLGFEITRQSSGQICLENLSEPSAEKFETMLKQNFSIIQEAKEIILQDMRENSFSHLEDMEDLKKQHDRYILFCRRVLMKNNVEFSIVAHWEILTALMQIEHQMYYLYEFSAKNKIKKNLEIISLFEKVIENYSLFSEAYGKKDIGAIHKINSQKEKLYFQESVALLKKSKGDEIVIVSYIRELFRKIQLGTSAVITFILQGKINN